MNRLYNFSRSFLRNTFLSIVGTYRKPAPGIHLLNGHRLKMSNETSDDFRYLMEYLSKSAKLVCIEEAVAMIVRHESPKEAIIAFTFDDGFTECYTHFAPVLEDYGINGLFFINPNYVEGDDIYIDNFNKNIVLTPNKRPMRWIDIKNLQRKGHIIGAHTMDHFLLNDSNMATLEYQIGMCKSILEEKLGEPCEYFAFPYGRLKDVSHISIDIAFKYYKYVFSQSDYKHYFSFDGRVINRRHFEPFWPVSHIKYFLSVKKI